MSMFKPSDCANASVKTWLGANKHGRLRLGIWTDHLPEEAVREHFDGDVLRVDEPYPIPDEVVSFLNLRQTCISPGVYRVTKSRRVWVVEF